MPNGLRMDGFLDAWRKQVADPDCVGLEIVEYNPLRDQKDQTLAFLTALVWAALDKYQSNRG